MNVKQIKDRLAALKAQGLTLLNAADAAGGTLTAAQETELLAIETEVKELTDKLEAAERLAERRRAMAGDSIQANRVEVGNDRAALDPMCGFRSSADFAQAVMRANPNVGGGSVDPRLGAIYQAAPTGYGREAGGNEGYLVPAEIRDRIWGLMHEADNLFNECDVEPTNSNSVTDLTDETTPWGATGIKSYWRSEAQQMTATRQSVEPRIVQVNELYAFVSATEELIADAPRLSARLENKAAEAIAWKIDDAIHWADGIGKPLGFMNGNSLVTVAKKSGQAADTLVVENVVNMFARLLPASLPRAHWRINSDVLPQLMTMTLGDQPIWTPPSTGIVNAPGGLLLGRPIRFTEHCKTLGDLGDIMLIDPKGYYGLRRDGGPQFASSIHLWFDYGVQAFRWTFRFGGQPHLKSAVSPKNGSATKSHFVTLAARA